MKLKRIAAALLSAVMMIALAIPVGAESIATKAKSISVNKTYQATATEEFIDNTYKFTVSSKTTITLTVKADFEQVRVYLLDADGNEMGQKNQKAKSGEWLQHWGGASDYYLEWNKKIEKAEGSADYTLLKGTYYIQFAKDYNGGQDLVFKITDPNAESVTSLSLSLALEEGDSVKLGGVVSPSSAKVTWKSSDTAVATVSSSGKVTAVSLGKATITATAGGKTAKILIIVS
jgi:hypothetical protein